MTDLDATVVAIATPPGRGGVGCVRLSGPDAVSIAARLFQPARRPGAAAALRFGRFLGRDGRAVDHGYLVLFPAEASFTGEPTAELWPHGSPAVLAELVETAIERGAHPAGPGEFTYRALRHGRLDLARAEAVRDLVEARTLYQARTALAQAEGSLSRRLLPLRALRVELIARAEAAVEFVDEAGTHLVAGALDAGIRDAGARCAALLTGFHAGRLVREGAMVVLAGPPNVGKSSLFNSLLERARAIVTPVPGTTRDTLEETLDLDGVPVRLVDTAGARDGGDLVEQEGIRRARLAREEADLILLVSDASRPLAAEPDPLDGRTLAVENKSDLMTDPDSPPLAADAVRVSARTGAGLTLLRARMRERLMGAGPIEDPIVSNARHARALEAAGVALDRAAEALRAGFTEEVVLEDLRDAVERLGEITGAFTTEDLFDRIFSTFCIGK